MNLTTTIDETSAKALGAFPNGHPAVRKGKVGVLLLNLGTPDGTDYWSVRRYLSEFLSDPRVIESPQWLWQPILQGVVLSTRPQKSGENYARIWDKEANESPLRVITRKQATKLQERLGKNIIVDFAMRYGNPSTKSGIDALQAAGCQKILLAPLYPQYSATTTATANDKAFDALKKLRWQPAVRTLPAYYRRAGLYRSAGPEHCRSSARGAGFRPLTSSSPPTTACRCSISRRATPITASASRRRGCCASTWRWSEEKLKTTFQSRFGPTKWLEPYTDARRSMRAARAGRSSRVAVVAPAFSSDCIETLEEIAIETGREQFDHAGGERYAYIPCLNDSPEGMAVIETITRRELMGWV
jgi:ferrochelatase